MDRWFILWWGGERLKVNMVGEGSSSENGAQKSHGNRSHCDPSPYFHYSYTPRPSPRAVPSKRAVNGATATQLYGGVGHLDRFVAKPPRRFQPSARPQHESRRPTTPGRAQKRAPVVSSTRVSLRVLQRSAAIQDLNLDPSHNRFFPGHQRHAGTN